MLPRVKRENLAGNTSADHRRIEVLNSMRKLLRMHRRTTTSPSSEARTRRKSSQDETVTAAQMTRVKMVLSELEVVQMSEVPVLKEEEIEAEEEASSRAPMSRSKNECVIE